MAANPETRLTELGITLPTPAAAVANYVPWVQAGTLLFVSGQLPLENGKPAVTGRMGDTVTIDDGIRAARLCGLNLLAQARAACGGDLNRVKRLVRMTAFVAGTADFFDQPKVINGASDLMVEVLGEAGRHARVAVGVAALPLNVACEIEAIFELG